MSDRSEIQKINIPKLNMKPVKISGRNIKSTKLTINSAAKGVSNKINHNITSKTLKSTVDGTNYDEKTICTEKSKIKIYNPTNILESYSMIIAETEVSEKVTLRLKKIDKYNMKLIENKLSGDYFKQAHSAIEEIEVDNENLLDENLNKFKYTEFTEKNIKENKKGRLNHENSVKNENCKNFPLKNLHKQDTLTLRKSINAYESSLGLRNKKILTARIDGLKRLDKGEKSNYDPHPIMKIKNIRDSLQKLKTSSTQSPVLTNFKLDYYINTQLTKDKEEE
jgi:hypothetical protein